MTLIGGTRRMVTMTGVMTLIVTDINTPSATVIKEDITTHQDIVLTITVMMVTIAPGKTIDVSQNLIEIGRDGQTRHDNDRGRDTKHHSPPPTSKF